MYVYTFSFEKVELPKSMMAIPDLFSSFSKIFSGFKSQWIISSYFKYFKAYNI